MIGEYQYILKNDVLEIVPRPEENFVVYSKQIYKIKHAADGSVEMHKDRFVAHGLSQKEGEDYEGMLSPIARYDSIRFVIALASLAGWKLHQMDVKIDFLKGVIEEDVYIEQPKGFDIHDKDTCRFEN